MDYQKLANLLFKEELKSPEEYEEIYPTRDLNKKASVTRLGPSPTGFIHVGNLYGALVDKLEAKKNNGVMFLRIEDTDRTRYVEGAEELIINSLKHFEIEFDEGVTLIGDFGDYGPYRQSERVSIYHTFAKKLVENGRAYPSFESEKEIEEIRNRQIELSIETGIYGEWARHRELSLEEVDERLAGGEDYVLRLKSEGNKENSVKIVDAIRGELIFPENFQDIVLLKSDGVPTYHFAHVVDDHLMRTTHVIRGEEWLSTLAVHLELFKALGWRPPTYCHTAHLMKMDGDKKRKLSKRLDPELSLEYYMELGCFPEAMLEYLMTLINSDFEEWRRNNPDKSIYDFPFTLKKMGKSGALFDLKKLEDVSKDTLSRLSDQRIYDFLLEWARAYEPEFAKLMEDDENFIKLIGIGRNRKKPRKDLAYARQIFEYMNFYFDDYYKVYDRLPENVNKEDAVKFLEEYLKTYESSSDNNEWFDKVKAISEPMGFATNMKEYKENPDKFKGSVSDLCNVIRLTMNGRLESADLCDIGKVMGDERVRDRIEKFINTIK